MSLELANRTKKFAVRIIFLYKDLLNHESVGHIFGKQLLRSGTSIGANIAEGEGSQSQADFLTKMSIAQKEARETFYWLDLLELANLVSPTSLKDIKQECNQIIAILTSTCKKIKNKKTGIYNEK